LTPADGVVLELLFAPNLTKVAAEGEALPLKIQQTKKLPGSLKVES
jgi:hypothetical protein